MSFKILELCVDKGGSITGEHGVGEEKKMMMGYMFSEPDLDTMQRVRCAFDPLSLANPTKVFPRPRMCGESTGRIQAASARDRGHCGEILGRADRRATVGRKKPAEILRCAQ